MIGRFVLHCGTAFAEDKTVIVIAYRLQSICNADQIAVLDDGHIAEKGTHDEMPAYNGSYAKLWNEQNHAGSWRILG